MGIFGDIRSYLGEAWEVWNRFWFKPTDPATLSLIRVLAGALLFYTHLVWTFDLQAFIGPEGWLPVEYLRNHLQVTEQLDGTLTPIWSVWSVFFWIEQPWAVWCVHILALVVFFCLMVGQFSRISSVLGFLLAVSYAQRVSPGAFWGLDKVNCMMALYLMLGPCGARYSLDRLWRLRRGDTSEAPASATANLAIRLLQMQLCIIYLFSGLAKMQGENWQAGTAVWWAVANFEYQSIDMTWLAGYPALVALATHVTVFWESFYIALIWNRFMLPITLWIAVAVHGGIALFMGMITFGLAMIFANLSFVSPSTVRRWVDPLADRVALKLSGDG